MKNFDPDHRGCIFPKYGAIVDAAMRGKDLSATDVAKHLKIDPSGPAGWRRGFGRNNPTRTAQLEALLGVRLDMSEVVPSAKLNAVGRDDQVINDAPLTDPVLPHLAAIALAHGFRASFTPL
jgi:ribosome-binding protein aMBF1 (putative translation factor)